MTTAEKQSAALSIVRAVADTVREVGTAPAGMVYLAFMSKGYTMDDFYAVVGFLVRAELVAHTNETLTWIGPK